MTKTSPLPDKDGNERERASRLAALAKLSQGQEQSEASARFPHRTESAPYIAKNTGQWSNRRIMVASSLVLILALAASLGLYVATRAHPKRAVITPQTPLNPVVDGMNCDRDIAWSPDGSRIVVLGYKYDIQAQGQCPEDSPSSYLYEPGLIHLYDAKTKKLAVELHPDDLISSALHLPTVDTVTPMAGTRLSSPEPKVINYLHVLWSPDGTRLAITFFANLPGQSNAWDSGVQGVLILRPDGSGAQVLSHAAAAGAPTFWVEWNLATGAPVSPSGSHTADSGQNPIPAALNYSWTGDDALTPQMQIQPGGPSIAAPPLSSIGDPIGGVTFTMWQPLRLSIITYQDPTTHQTQVIPDVYSAESDYVSWSPDGRYLALMGYVGLLEPNGPPTLTPAEAQALNLGQYPKLPVRDKALVAALALVSQDPNHSVPVSVAWKPDGRRLAVTSVNLDPSGAIVPTSYRVLLFDCATGTKLATLTPDVVNETVHDNNGTYLRWSPDGKKLLLADGGLGTITVWSGKLLS